MYIVIWEKMNFQMLKMIVHLNIFFRNDDNYDYFFLPNSVILRIEYKSFVTLLSVTLDQLNVSMLSKTNNLFMHNPTI